MRESDLYPPLKAYLQAQGYVVKGEVGDCDVTAIRGHEPPVVVELKLSLNLSLILQAVDRLGLTTTVYIGVPLGCKFLTKQRKRIEKLLRMLGLGLVVIDTMPEGAQGPGATAALWDPGPYKPRISPLRRARLLAEFEGRRGDPTEGGKDRRKGRITAYRQRTVRIAQHLATQGKSKAALIAQAIGEPKARDILYRDVYGWFERHGAGLYSLSPRGTRELENWRSPATGLAGQCGDHVGPPI